MPQIAPPQRFSLRVPATLPGYTLNDVARMAGCHEMTIRRRAAARGVRPLKYPNLLWFDADAVEVLIAPRWSADGDEERETSALLT